MVDRVNTPVASSTEASFALANRLAVLVHERGGRSYLVGGAVRDAIMGSVPHDLDIEVHGLAPGVLSNLCYLLGRVDRVGVAFAILKVQHGQAVIDVSLPRRDSKSGRGHSGFTITTEPELGITAALARRDFTINAIACDLISGAIYDPFDGRRDCREHRLRVVDADTFADDPLRVLRALQFVARFDLAVNDSTTMRCLQQTVQLTGELSAERFRDEWRKLLCAPKPSLGLLLAETVGLLALQHPELACLRQVPQDQQYHAEGDVLTHTACALDACADLCAETALTEAERLTLALAVLLHDTGKAATTTIDQERGRVHAYGHEAAGIAPARAFMQTVGIDHATQEKVVRLVAEHMWPHTGYRAMQDGAPPSDGAVRRLAARLYPATIRELAHVALADRLGRQNADTDAARAEATWLEERAAALQVQLAPAAHILSGKWLIEHGYAPSPLFGQVIACADRLRDEQAWTYERLVDLFVGLPNLFVVLIALEEQLSS